MKGKTVLITGATDGIGKQTAIELAARGAEVLLHGRTQLKAEYAAREAQALTGNKNVLPVAAELSSLREVRHLAARVSGDHAKLHVLINNAGVYLKQRRLSEEGFEMTFAVNHLAHFLLTHLLLDTLKQSAPARILNVSSVAHQRGTIEFDDLQMSRAYDAYSAYAQSKLANVMMAIVLARRLEGTGVTVNALHPGVIGTKLLRAGFSMRGDSVKKGAETPVFLASAPELEGVTGEYFVDCAQHQPAPQARDKSAQERLWNESMRFTGLVPECQTV